MNTTLILCPCGPIFHRRCICYNLMRSAPLRSICCMYWTMHCNAWHESSDHFLHHVVTLRMPSTGCFLLKGGWAVAFLLLGGSDMVDVVSPTAALVALPCSFCTIKHTVSSRVRSVLGSPNRSDNISGSAMPLIRLSFMISLLR